MSGLTAMILAPFFLAICRAESMRGWLVPRVLADDEDDLGLVQVVERDGAFAQAQRGAQGRAAALVAHVGAVGQVVGAELRGRKAGTGKPARSAPCPRCRIHGFVRRFQRVQLPGDEVERIGPGDGRVVVVAGALHHRVREAAGVVLVAVGHARELGQTVLGEKLGAGGLVVGIRSSGFGPVLAELGHRAVLVGVGPGAAGAVEAILLVQAQQGLGAAPHAALRPAELHGLEDGRDTPAAIFSRASSRRPVRASGGWARIGWRYLAVATSGAGMWA